MNKLIAVFLLSASTVLAGSNQPEVFSFQTPITDYYRSGEFQVDTFGVFAHAARNFDNNVWGEGLQGNYFFTRNFGVGVDGYALQNSSIAGQVGGSFVARLPIGRFAPFAYIGGGYLFNDAEPGHNRNCRNRGYDGQEERIRPTRGGRNRPSPPLKPTPTPPPARRDRPNPHNAHPAPTPIVILIPVPVDKTSPEPTRPETPDDNQGQSRHNEDVRDGGLTKMGLGVEYRFTPNISAKAGYGWNFLDGKDFATIKAGLSYAF